LILSNEVGILSSVPMPSKFPIFLDLLHDQLVFEDYLFILEENDLERENLTNSDKTSVPKVRFSGRNCLSANWRIWNRQDGQYFLG
jgi:hypothetical protein